MSTLSILCVHGVGHGEVDPNLQPSWTDAITESVQRWSPETEPVCDFLRYDDLFDKAQLDEATVLEAAGRLLGSGLYYGIGDVFRKKRGLLDIPDKARWTAGMVAQWAADEDLRAMTRQAVIKKVQAGNYDVVCAHSLGSLICYDAFSHAPDAIQGKRFISLGSQIGNPCVRGTFAGRIEPLKQAATWHHLYNPEDHVLTAEVRVTAENFFQVLTEFDIPNDILNHDAPWYLRHENAVNTVWREVAGAKVTRALTTVRKVFSGLSAKPDRRALLVGINQYPDPKDRLEGCVNDVFLMSSVLQECGFDPQDIRVVLDERATTQGIMDRLHWLLDDVKPDQERVLFYSGHGAQIPAYNLQDEYDRKDECLVPYDFDWSPERAIVDNQFFNLYSQLPYESRFVAIFDCCHSGGMAREGGRKVRGLTPPDDIRHRALQWNADLQMWEERKETLPQNTLSNRNKNPQYVGLGLDTYRFGRAMRLRSLAGREDARVRAKLGHKGPYLPVLLEACQEQELASEYRHGVTSYGAFTYCLAQELRQQRAQGRNPTFAVLIKAVTSRLKTLHYDQTPALLGPTEALRHPIPWTAGGKRKAQGRKTGRK